MTKIGLFTGSFDPITVGHLDIIERASRLFDKLYIGVFYNKEKAGLFDVETRAQMIREAVAHLEGVEVMTSAGQLAVEVARKYQVTHLVRGLRNAVDLDYEANLEFFNRYLAEELETVYLMASHRYQPISSSRVRELIYFKSPITDFVPESVVKQVEKMNDNN
ncbi:pantetheine-phosphate adenylyltransferase [Streptococcus hillyeri]|uniref:Phosphopantetheine adenylyltransferase n=1 Tax=Streptococcus hillyeri TaxID=2282420 RepID=A0A3L9DRW6_9STRE|nr:pantetheine-phosphate adenylyltransferase [Streptococcus hillyeri]RLY04196.1 pantetheine-phosphate adenylyltransferase [Streptococcus hillyeri]